MASDTSNTSKSSGMSFNIPDRNSFLLRCAQLRASENKVEDSPEVKSENIDVKSENKVEDKTDDKTDDKFEDKNNDLPKENDIEINLIDETTPVYGDTEKPKVKIHLDSRVLLELQRSHLPDEVKSKLKKVMKEMLLTSGIDKKNSLQLYYKMQKIYFVKVIDECKNLWFTSTMHANKDEAIIKVLGHGNMFPYQEITFEEWMIKNPFLAVVVENLIEFHKKKYAISRSPVISESIKYNEDTSYSVEADLLIEFTNK